VNDKLSILIADRNRHIRHFLRREFIAEGCWVQEAKNKKEVLKIIDANSPPDVLVLELDMPIECAFEILEKLQNQESALPVIIHTSLTDYKNHPACKWTDAFVEKCEDPTYLKNIVADVLRQKYPKRFKYLYRESLSKDNINLLIVDDEERFLETMSKTLETRGFNVVAVNGGEKALKAAQEHSVDIALVDLKMPGMDGKEVLWKLKKEHEWIEVVILTGYGSIDSVVECVKSGAFSYFNKPCNLDQLMEVLTEAYKKRVLNKMKIEEDRMEHIIKNAGANSPRDVLRRLKQLEQNGQ